MKNSSSIDNGKNGNGHVLYMGIINEIVNVKTLTTSR